MTKTDRAILSLQILSLLVATEAFPQLNKIQMNWYSLQSAYLAHSIKQFAEPLFQILIPLALILGTAVLIWRNSANIAYRIFPQSAEEDFESREASSIHRKKLLIVALIVLGIWLFATSVPHLFTDAYRYSAIKIAGVKTTEREQRFPPNGYPLYFSDAVQCIAGMLLLFWNPVRKSYREFLFNRSQVEVSLPSGKKLTSSLVCPYCKNLLAEDLTAVCKECGTRYHSSCWDEHGGCAVFGCEGSRA